MRLAFATGALSTGFVAAAGTALVIWVATILTGSSDPWSAAPWLVPLIAALVAVATYLAEGVAYRRSQERMRSSGEPWAYRRR
jgi:apolipoprotein N-acyltransferase